MKGTSGTSAGAAALKVSMNTNKQHSVLDNSADTCNPGRNGGTLKRQDVTLALGDSRVGPSLAEASPTHQSSPTGM